MTTIPVTAAVNRRTAAEAALARAATLRPDSDAYRNLVQTAIAWTLPEIADTLAVLASYLEPPPVPQVPGLPIGYQLGTTRSEGGSRRHGYILTCPDGETIRSRFLWAYPDTALAEGLRHAVHLDAGLAHAGRWSGARPDRAGTGEEVPGA